LGNIIVSATAGHSSFIRRVKQIAAALTAVFVLALIGVAVLLSFLPEDSDQRSPLYDAAVYQECALALVRVLVEDEGLIPTAPASPASGYMQLWKDPLNGEVA
jgi:hypothetical protein